MNSTTGCVGHLDHFENRRYRERPATLGVLHRPRTARSRRKDLCQVVGVRMGGRDPCAGLGDSKTVCLRHLDHGEIHRYRAPPATPGVLHRLRTAGSRRKDLCQVVGVRIGGRDTRAGLGDSKTAWLKHLDHEEIHQYSPKIWSNVNHILQKTCYLVVKTYQNVREAEN